MLHANITALCFIEPELLLIEVLHCENRIFRPFWLLWPWSWTDDLHIWTWLYSVLNRRQTTHEQDRSWGLDTMTLIYELKLKILKIYLHTKTEPSRSRLSKLEHYTAWVKKQQSPGHFTVVLCVHMLTDVYNIRHRVYWEDMQHESYWFACLAYRLHNAAALPWGKLIASFQCFEYCFFW